MQGFLAAMNGVADGQADRMADAVACLDLSEISEIIRDERGPELAIDLKEVIHDRFGVDYHERSVSRLLHELGFSHMSARPRHPGQDPEMLETYKKTSPGRSPRR